MVGREGPPRAPACSEGQRQPEGGRGGGQKELFILGSGGRALSGTGEEGNVGSGERPLGEGGAAPLQQSQEWVAGSSGLRGASGVDTGQVSPAEGSRAADGAQSITPSVLWSSTPGLALPRAARVLDPHKDQ